VDFEDTASLNNTGTIRALGTGLAINDCGCELQVADSRKVERGPLTSMVTSARFAAFTSRPVTVPALTPATRTSEPETRPKALSSSIR